VFGGRQCQHEAHSGVKARTCRWCLSRCYVCLIRRQLSRIVSKREVGAGSAANRMKHCESCAWRGYAQVDKLTCQTFVSECGRSNEQHLPL
jgi:hypothetical protein